MKQFATYEEENIHYWTNRAYGYSQSIRKNLPLTRNQSGAV